MYCASFIISYYDQQMHNYFTNYHTPTCFDTVGHSMEKKCILELFCVNCFES